MKKLVVLMLVLAVVAWGIVSFIGIGKGSNEPSAPDAPFIVTTSSRIYYVKDYSGIAPNITLHGYYERVGKRWLWRKGSVELSGQFGSVTVLRRVQ